MRIPIQAEGDTERAAKEEAAAALEKSMQEVADTRESSREVLKKAIEAKKALQAKVTSLTDQNKALEAKVSGGGEEEWVRVLRADLEASRSQVEEMGVRLQEVLEDKEETARRLSTDVARLEDERGRETRAVEEATQRAAAAEERVAALEAQAQEAVTRAAMEETRAQQAASAASGSHQQLLARQDELCRKLNDAEEAAATARRRADADLAAAKKASAEAVKAKEVLLEEAAAREKAALAELAAVKEAAKQSEALREQVVALGKEVAQLQRKLLQAETEGEAGAKMQAAELESVKEKSKVYIKKAVDQQKVLQARVRELEEQLEQQRSASERARMDAMFSTTKAQDIDAELAASREAKQAAEAQLEAVTAEFSRYKARAHTLLKQADDGTGGGSSKLDELTRMLASKESVVKSLREQVAQQEKLRAAAEQAATDRQSELDEAREQLECLENAHAAQVRTLNLKMDTLQREADSADEARSAFAFLSHSLQLEAASMEARVQGTEDVLERARVALPLLQSHLFEAQMHARECQRRAAAAAAAAAPATSSSAGAGQLGHSLAGSQPSMNGAGARGVRSGGHSSIFAPAGAGGATGGDLSEPCVVPWGCSVVCSVVCGCSVVCSVVRCCSVVCVVLCGRSVEHGVGSRE